MRPRRLGVAAAALVLALVVPSTGVAQNKEPESLSSMLARRATAINTGDEVAFMSTVSSDATTEMRAAQLRSFRGMRAAGVVNASFTVVNGVDGAPLLRSGKRALSETKFTYRIGGADQQDVTDSQYITYANSGGGWTVLSDTDAEAVGLRTQRNIWDVTDVARVDSPGFVTLFRPDQRERAEALQRTAEQARSRLQSEWPRPLPGRIPLLLPPTPGDADRLLEGGQQAGDYLAFVTYRTSVDGGWKTSPPRMLAQDSNLSLAGSAAQEATMVHELVHAASAPIDGPFTPAWLHEGVAEWVRLGRPAGLAPATTGPLGWPPASRFVSQGADLAGAYTDATSAVSHLASRHGPDAPFRLIEAIGARRLEAGTAAYNLDEAVRSVTGQSLADLQTGWNRDFGRS